jgi:arabinan endo-1,5-alpha-L-arabinosidase
MLFNTLADSKMIFPQKPTRIPIPEINAERFEWHGYFSHDPAIFYDESENLYYIYSTDAGPNAINPAGGQIRLSSDLIHFNYIGVALIDGVPPEVKDYTNARGIWAPDIIKVDNEYRLYYSASTFGSQTSAIGLATSNSPKGPFIHQGFVVKTTPSSPVNAIDANIVIEEETGTQYLVYGSFWGGIRILKLDNKTGFTLEDGYGLSIAKRNKSVDGALEGAFIRYNPATKYYYLFVSYESLTNHYNVRVARSQTITGPYLDYHGNAMTNQDDNPYEIGLKITSGYSFKEGTGWFAFGHNSVFHNNQSNDWFLVCHARMEANPHMHSLHIHKMLWTLDGWPVISPFQYAGEEIQPIEANMIPGTYARITFQQNMDHIITPYTIMNLHEDGTCTLDFTPIQCAKGYTNTLPEHFRTHEPPLVPAAQIYSELQKETNEANQDNLVYSGTWKLDNFTLTLEYNNIKETIFLLPSWDFEEDTNTLALTGMNQNGICIWGKKL